MLILTLLLRVAKRTRFVYLVEKRVNIFVNVVKDLVLASKR
jgi:hypothetical protein